MNVSAHHDWQKRLDDLEARGRLRGLADLEPLPGHRVRTADGALLLNLASNDYLGLGCDLSVQEAFLAKMAAEPVGTTGGFTASASRLMSGNHPACTALENLIAQAYGNGRCALVFNSGYHANLGILPSLAQRGDVILADRLAHASLIDGIRLSRAAWQRYRHGDTAHLRALLAAHPPAPGRRTFIVTESIFSMDGDCAPLHELVVIKREHDAILIVDEAHAVGVRGAHGLGLAEEAGLLADVDILVGTFGKALASVGAFAVVEPLVRDLLVNTMRSLIYTTALPPITLEWTRHVFAYALKANDRRRQLAANADLFRRELARITGKPANGSHIVPLVAGADQAAVTLAARLRGEGYLVPPVRPPSVPPGTARLRFSICAGMNPDDLASLVRLAGIIQRENAP
ncbi:8-amino-7-oxononanoate synthase [Desulfonatronum sp. SC1]|uniref:aminotransferase class I/II-fold pyridoxal phosphate-dependent enzyme n=1 Tax=Desulfonatronum sp. SC1 TaxID=2109626 RepID=UPI000D30EDC9|nr:8-amino-7-oxononanoate synthase [Desulfonatronum sp. SC1]PTN36993.1 8-amino-7-oxononanoate synthase [Desulfonatronum sp. SC1]